MVLCIFIFYIKAWRLLVKPNPTGSNLVYFCFTSMSEARRVQTVHVVTLHVLPASCSGLHTTYCFIDKVDKESGTNSVVLYLKRCS